MKNLIKCLFVLLITTVISSKLKAQLTGSTSNIDLSFISDRNVILEKYADVNGSPYLLKDWISGDVKIGTFELKNVLLKYDEIENRIIIKGENDEIKTFTNPVSEFKFLENLKSNTPRVFRAGFNPSGDMNIKTFYEVLIDGKVKFLRKNIKVISENKEYSGNISKSVVENMKFFLVTEKNIPVPIKLDQKSITAVLGDKGRQLNEYINTSKLNLKKQEDAAKLIAYYNSL